MENINLLKKIKIARITKGLNQEDIAKELNVSIPTYSRFENGVTKINFTFLQKVCKFLEINLHNVDDEFKFDLIEDNNKVKLDDFNQLNTDEKLKLIIQLLNKQQDVNKLLIKTLKEIKAEKVAY